MAKQIAGLCFLEGTFDDLVFYKMDGQYYVRVKSSLTGERVKTAPEFRITMYYADMLVRASRIGSQIYKALPPGWRQFWMYRAFTGEAFTLLKDGNTPEAIIAALWQCYVAYWEERKAVDPDNPIFQAKPKKIRKRRVYSEESIKRMKDKWGKPKWRDPAEEERKRIAKERNDAAYARLLEKQASSLEPRAASNAVQEVEQASSFELRAASFSRKGAIPFPFEGCVVSGVVVTSCFKVEAGLFRSDRRHAVFPKLPVQSIGSWRVAADGSLFVHGHLDGHKAQEQVPYLAEDST